MSGPLSCERRWRAREHRRKGDHRRKGGGRHAPARWPETAVIRLALPGAGSALFTTRADGNLSTLRGPGHERGNRLRDGLCEELGLRCLSAGRQVHGTTVQRVRAPGGGSGQAGEIQADGHATGLPGLGMMVLVADCLPVILGSEEAVAALHVGWRGLAAGVIEEGVGALRELGGLQISAVIGPGAGVCCYEVGEEVHEALGFEHRRGSHIDLKAIAGERLLRMGVDVRDLGLCTICDPRFFSHRREGERAGRQAGVAWLS
jgi:polyphenol oxidase